MSFYCWGEYPNIRKTFLYTLIKALYTLNKASTASMLNWNDDIADVPASMIAPQVQTHRLPEVFAEAMTVYGVEQ